MAESVYIEDVLKTSIDPEARGAAANEYLLRDWSVVPIHPATKRPLTRHGFNSGITAKDTSRVAEWNRKGPHWDAHWLGIATGAVVNVLDVDVKDGKRGAEAVEKLEAAGLLAGALGVARTPSGGWHYYFTASGEKSRSNAEWGLDWQCLGKGVVAPPSPGYYWETWTGKGAGLDWLEVCKVLDIRKPAGEAAIKRATEKRSVRNPVAYANEICEQMARSTDGSRNNELFIHACQLAELTDSDYLFNKLEDAGVAAGLSHTETQNTIRSARAHVGTP